MTESEVWMSFFHYSIVTGRNSSLDMKAGKLLNKTGFEKTIVDEEPVVRKNDVRKMVFFVCEHETLGQ